MPSAKSLAGGHCIWCPLLSVAPLLLWASSVAGQAQQSTEKAAELLADIERVAGEQTGILQFNQSAADGTQQSNSLSVSAVSNNGAAIANATSSQQSPDNQFPAPLSGTAVGGNMSEVANNSNGIVAINQSVATGSTQTNNMAIATASGSESAAFASAGSVAGVSLRDSSNGPVVDTALISGSATMSNVGSGSNGIIAINQSAGIGGGQANLLAISAAPDGVADASVIASNRSPGQRSDFSGSIAGPLSIADSFNNSRGLIQLNQSSGGYNNQTNLLAIAIGQQADATAISDNGLSDVAPHFDEPDAIPEVQQGKAKLDGSFDGFIGVAQVTQSSGFGNSISNKMTVTIINLPGAGL